MEKSADAFRTISEVADELSVPKHVLRFWEGKFSQIKPMKRGGGRRYYRPEDVELLRGIRRLLHDEGYTIKGVQKVIREQGIDFVKTCWRLAPESTKAGGKQGGAPAGSKKAEAPQPGPDTHLGRNGSTAPFRLSRANARVLNEVLAELEKCKRLLGDDT